MSEAEAMSEQDTSEVPQRPDLHVIHTDDLPDVPEGTVAEAPLLYRIHAGISEAAKRLPSVWSERHPSFAERIEYSLRGDWTTAQQESGARRSAHLIATFLCMPVGWLGALLLWASDSPRRTGIVLAALILVGYVIG